MRRTFVIYVIIENIKYVIIENKSFQYDVTSFSRKSNFKIYQIYF